MKQLDFSIGTEPQIFVRFSGWPSDAKASFTKRAAELYGVLMVGGAGAGEGAYVTFSPEQTNEASLSALLAKLANELVPGHAW